VSGPLSAEAVAFALERHGADGAIHPTEAGALLLAADEPETIVAAGLLHDVVEDTDTTPAEIEARFGARVAEIVGALTEDASIEDYSERKADLRARIAAGGRDVAVVSAADKLSKVRALGRTGAALPPPKAEHYRESIAIVSRLAPRHPLAVKLEDEWRARAQGDG
jgi:(p)ppGpp synthase/HD superfamily hydrolase